MQLSAENIQNQQFHVRFRGFDVDEVDSFLIKVAENYQLLFVENQRLRELVSRLEDEQDQVQSQEKSFKNAIISAQTIADQMQEKAKVEATELLNKTEDNVNKMIAEAEAKSANLRREINILKEQKSVVKEELTAFLSAYLRRVEDDSLVNEQPDYPADDGKFAEGGKVAQAPVELAEIDLPAEELVDSAADFDSDEEEAAGVAVPEFVEDEELADLYQKIDLSDMDEEEAKEFDLSEISIPQEEDENNLPDINGDLSFSLDDPIDEDSADNGIALKK